MPKIKSYVSCRLELVSGRLVVVVVDGASLVTWLFVELLSKSMIPERSSTEKVSFFGLNTSLPLGSSSARRCTTDVSATITHTINQNTANLCILFLLCFIITKNCSIVLYNFDDKIYRKYRSDAICINDERNWSELCVERTEQTRRNRSTDDDLSLAFLPTFRLWADSDKSVWPLAVFGSAVESWQRLSACLRSLVNEYK